jgi:hypothetical protein
MSVSCATFGISNHMFGNMKRLNIVLPVTFTLVCLIAMLAASRFQAQYWKLFALVSLVVFVAIFLISIVTTRFMVKRLRQTRLQFGPSELVRVSGVFRQAISWDNITKIRFHQKFSGELLGIEVYCRNGSPLSLTGFESMPEVAECIKQHIPSTVQVENKRHRLNMDNHVTLVATIVLAALCFGAIYRIGGQIIAENLTSLIQLALGIYFLGYGPLSRANPNLRKLEIGLGIVVIAAALFAASIRFGLHGRLW